MQLELSTLKEDIESLGSDLSTCCMSVQRPEIFSSPAMKSVKRLYLKRMISKTAFNLEAMEPILSYSENEPDGVENVCEILAPVKEIKDQMVDAIKHKGIKREFLSEVVMIAQTNIYIREPRNRGTLDCELELVYPYVNLYHYDWVQETSPTTPS